MVKIKAVDKGSFCDRHGVKSGDTLLSVNGHEIEDILDYRFYTVDEKVKLRFLNSDQKEYRVKIKKQQYDDIGLEFETYLMDKQHSCRNKCIFCFIDQLPKGLRESLYFKDDDERLSFFFGNYITLTNLSEHDISRIITMHISPVNISVHTMNPDLRVEMMKNPKAGECLSIIDRLADAGIEINAQLVLCPGINDGDELVYSLERLSNLYPSVQSIAAVPIGLTKFREGLYHIDPYNRDTASKTIDIIENFGRDFKEKHGTSLAFAADEFYQIAGREMPPYEYYEDFSQLENGVGMVRSFDSEITEELSFYEPAKTGKKLSFATGKASFELISSVAQKLDEVFGTKTVVYQIDNDFFGRSITVAGLVTAGDIINQLSGKELGENLLIPKTMLKSSYPNDETADSDLFLDSISLSTLIEKLGTNVVPMPTDAASFVKKFAEVIECQNL